LTTADAGTAAISQKRIMSPLIRYRAMVRCKVEALKAIDAAVPLQKRQDAVASSRAYMLLVSYTLFASLLRFALLCFALLYFTLLCFALLCFALLCLVLLGFAWLCLTLLGFA
jgi:hypothetical protein